MKHTDLYKVFKELDTLERLELIAAVKAHGGEYVFIHMASSKYEVENESEIIKAPVILGSYKYDSSYDDFYVSRVKVENCNGTDILSLYGWKTDPGRPDEQIIDDVVFGHISTITDAIPETESVKDVTIKPTRHA